MISESNAETEKLRRKKRWKLQPDHGVTHALLLTDMPPHSLLAAASEDPADVQRQTAEVPAVQTHPHGLVAQLTQGQSHGTEVQQPTAETHTHTLELNLWICDLLTSITDACWFKHVLHLLSELMMVNL